MNEHAGDIEGFKAAAQQLVEDPRPQVWAATTKQLDGIFRANADFVFEKDRSMKETCGGYALRPSEAARCLTDHVRTAQFSKGLFAAIKTAQQRFTERPIRVLYAGCGPFATLAMAVAPFFGKGEVEFTAIDVYETSLECAKRIARCLGQADKIKFKYGDATKLRVEGLLPHVIVTETMQAQLLTEPQPQITANLGNQLTEGGIFVPEEVEVKAFSGNAETNTLSGSPIVYEMEELGLLFKLTSNLAQTVKSGERVDEAKLHNTLNINVNLPVSEEAGRLSHVVLETRIKVFDGHAFGPDDHSGITARLVAPWAPISSPTRVKLAYFAGVDDEIHFRRCDAQGNERAQKVRNPREKGDARVEGWFGLQ